MFPSHRFKRRKPLDLAAVLKRQIKAAFQKLGIVGIGCHAFRHTVGTTLAEMGEHQLTIRDYLRTAMHVTNKYLQATAESKRLAQDKLVGAILPTVVGKQIEVVQRRGKRLIGPKRTLIGFQGSL